MGYIVLGLIGFVCGAAVIYVLFEKRHKALIEQQNDLDAKTRTLQAKAGDLYARERKLSTDLDEFYRAKAAFDHQSVTYQELQQESALLKDDLSRLHQQWRKTQLDHFETQSRNGTIMGLAQALGEDYMREQERWIGNSLNQNNYATCKTRLTNAIEKTRAIGISISAEEERRLFDQLKTDYEMVVRAAIEREEQARIRAQMREEAQRERELQRAMEQAAREKALVESALQRALAEAHGQHTAEVEALEARLAEAEAKSVRAISQAQLTKAGTVYVISNIGSFGEDIFKIGMTRRLEPMDRVVELGDASVPFPFDVHILISTNDAPALESALHHKFHQRRINRVNLRKEFFRVKFDEILETVRDHHGEVTYRADAEALQYRNSLQMSDSDLDMLEEVYGESDEEESIVADVE